MKIWKNMSESEKGQKVTSLEETYNNVELFSNAEDAAANIRTGYEENPNWFDFEVDDLDEFESDYARLMKDTFEDEVVAALRDCIDEIEQDGWTIPGDDEGPQSAGFHTFDRENVEVLRQYVKTAYANPDIDYVKVADFGEIEREKVDNIMSYSDGMELGLQREEIIGLIRVHEEINGWPYTLFIAHIERN